jgi:uncharacterized repeat protein (TIGR03803 family)
MWGVLSVRRVLHGMGRINAPDECGTILRGKVRHYEKSRFIPGRGGVLRIEHTGCHSDIRANRSNLRLQWNQRRLSLRYARTSDGWQYIWRAFSLTNESTVFQLTPSGALTTLYTFCSTCGQGVGALLQGSDGNLYGLTSGGGSYYGGTAFQLTLSGTLTVLYDFCSIPGCIDGQSPVALVQGDDGNFYGVTQSGGNNKSGTVFKLTPSGTFTTVYSFCSQTNCPDGARPSTLILGSDGNFYGTTYDFGNGLYCSLTAGTCGTVFRITPTGTFTTVYGFCSTLNVAKTLRPVCTDGSSPSALVQGKDGNLYGTTYAGGVRGLPGEVGEGTAFQLTPSGTLTTLYSFCQLANCADGSDPGALVQGSDGNFYGTTTLGGVEDDRYCTYGCGTFFQLTPGGVLTTGLYDFSRHNGVTPGGLVQASSGALRDSPRWRWWLRLRHDLELVSQRGSCADIHADQSKLHDSGRGHYQRQPRSIH